MTRFFALLTVLAATLLTACAAQPPRAGQSQPPSAETIQAQVGVINANLAQYRKVVGQWQNEQTTSTYQAYFDGSKPIYIVETAGGERTQGYAVNKYYYRDGALFYFRGQGSAGSADILNPQPAEIDIQLAFGVNGKLLRAIKTVNGRPLSLEPGEAAAIRGHAGELRRQALADLARAQ
ncbi:MAG TPA: hypothetical protein VFK45_08505 [Gammaproteobacteria bacterium]|nr:hypothetical protein [Gammaproteobacteria bacterium]